MRHFLLTACTPLLLCLSVASHAADPPAQAEAAERESVERSESERPGNPRERELRQPPADATRRLEHLRAASEHLHQAGLHELAEQVSREAMEVEHQLHANRRNAPHPEAMDKLMQHLQEVRRELQQLREEVKDLRNQKSER